MKSILLTAALAVGAAANAETICGKTLYFPEGVIARVSCVDFPALAKLGVPVPPGAQAQTQLLIDVPDGHGVDVTLDGQWRMDRVMVQPDGVRRALVSFDGIDHESMPDVAILVRK